MLLTPNKINYDACPHCHVTLNSFDWVPVPALAGNFQWTRCPMPNCGQLILVRIQVTFSMQIESDDPKESI